MLTLTHRLLDTLPALYGFQPLPPTLPHLLKVSALTLFWNARSTLEVIKHPEPLGPGSKHNVNHSEFFAQEERAFRVHLAREFFEVVEKLGLLVFEAVFALVLKEAVVRWYDTRSNICSR